MIKAAILTTSLIIGLISLCGQVSAATRQNTSSHSATFTQRHRAVQTREPAVAIKPEVTGVIPRAARGGNPLQMLNPFAPAKYGLAEENTVLDPDLPGRGDGIKLLSISW